MVRGVPRNQDYITRTNLMPPRVRYARPARFARRHLFRVSNSPADLGDSRSDPHEVYIHTAMMRLPGAGAVLVNDIVHGEVQRRVDSLIALQFPKFHPNLPSA